MRNTSKTILLGAGILILLGVMFMPVQTEAGLVQCGIDTNQDGSIDSSEACGFCDLFKLGHNIITFFLFPSADLNGGFAVVPSIAGLLFAVGGIYLLIGAGSPTLHEKGKKTLTSVVIGLIIVYTAWVFINTFLVFIGFVNWNGVGGGWWQIPCGI